jgi:indoleamine 2,3-dioxygenase
VGVPALTSILEAQKAISSNNPDLVLKALTIASNSIKKMVDVLPRMYEKNDPHIFWHRVRPYNAGSKNNINYPNGIFYEGVTDVDEFIVDHEAPDGMKGTWRKYAGASAGQSPLVHALDIGFGIEHGPMKPSPTSPQDHLMESSSPTSPQDHLMESSSPTKRPNPMHEMRSYLPNKCQEFLHAIGCAPSIREYLQSRSNDKTFVPIIEMFNECIMGLKAFRDAHIKLTSVYIISQQNKELGGKSVGTGGTELIPFLKQVRQETTNSLISDYKK